MPLELRFISNHLQTAIMQLLATTLRTYYKTRDGKYQTHAQFFVCFLLDVPFLTCRD